MKKFLYGIAVGASQRINQRSGYSFGGMVWRAIYETKKRVDKVQAH